MKTNSQLKRKAARIWRRHSGLVVLGSMLLLAASGWLLVRVLQSFGESNRPSETAAVADLWTLEQLLEMGNVSQLARRLRQVAKSNASDTNSFPIQFENAQQRIALADGISNLDPAPSDRRFAQNEKLSALIEREQLAVQNDFADKAYTTELEACGEALRDSDDTAVANLATVGQIVAGVSRAIQADDPAARDAALRQSTERIQAINDVDPFSVAAVQILSNWLQFAADKLQVPEYRPLTAAFVTTFSDAADTEVLELVAKAQEDLGNSQDFVDLVDALPPSAPQRFSFFSNR